MRKTLVNLHSLFPNRIQHAKKSVYVDHSENMYRSVFEHSMDAVFLTSPDGFFHAANPAACDLFGYSEAEFRKLHRNDVVDPDSPQLNDYLAERENSGRARAEIIFTRKDGTKFLADVSSEQFIDNQQNVRTIMTVHDITARKLAEEKLAESEEQYRLLIAAMEEGVVLQDENAKIITFNKSSERILGLSAEQLLGKTSFDPDWYAIHEDGTPFPGEKHPVVITLKTGEPQSNVIMGIHKPDGKLTWISVNAQPIFKEGKSKPDRVVATMHDITEHKQAQKHIERLAHFDQLTGLPNRTLLNDRFRYALSLAQRSGEALAIMFLDLDNFKDINDTLGHDMGDKVLMELAKRLKAAVREQDTLSRQGGDEYILILPATNADGAGLIADKLLEVIAKPCYIEQHELTVTASIGIAVYPHDGDTLEALSKNADIAMYRAKHEGHNDFRFYAPEMQEHSARNLAIANGLRNALERDELEVHYQPQFSLQDGRIIGVEALLRWQHPDLGLVSPLDFIPIAESTGQIIALGEWVLRTATKQLKAWLDNGLPPLTMAVNLSAMQFRQKTLPGLIDRILDEVKLPHNLLELELTEAVAMQNVQAAMAMMQRLYDRGIRMSIDDFGTGYSSLNYLKQFKVYKLKIDRSFVRDINTNPEDKAIVTAIINMASSLDLQTIAEGVETAQQLNFLRMQGCQEAQGYYFSKPLPAKLFEEYVRNITLNQ